MDVRDLLAGLSTDRIAELAGVDASTARRWKRTRELPEPARRLLEILTSGDLGLVSPTWQGWYLAADVLASSDGLCFKPSEIRSIPYVTAAWREQQRRNRLAKQADWVDGRYVEPAETLAPAHGARRA